MARARCSGAPQGALAKTFDTAEVTDFLRQVGQVNNKKDILENAGASGTYLSVTAG